jgi:sugar (pentulose or hexulose) kinase
VVTGAGDTAAALTALKATGLTDAWSHCLVVNLGTGIQLLKPGVTAQPRSDPDSHLYADADAGWYQMLAIRTAVSRCPGCRRCWACAGRPSWSSPKRVGNPATRSSSLF